MGKYVEDGYQLLRENELVAENQLLHDEAELLEADEEPDSLAPSYNFRSLLDKLAHRGKADIINYRHNAGDHKAMTWANGQHSPECGSWLKGRGRDFYPFPNPHTYYSNALNLLMSSSRDGQPFYCPCTSKVNIRADPWHCLDCPHTHSARNKCHSKILDALQHALSTVGEVKGSPRFEKKGKYIFSDLQFCRRSDTSLFYIDASTINPTANTYITKDGVPSPDHATSLREIEKMTQYEGVDSHPQSRHIPFAIECTGKLGKAAREFLKEAGLDDKKRNALKNEIASIVAFSNGECIAMAFLKGSTRPTNLSDDTQADHDFDNVRNSKFGVSQQSWLALGHTAGQSKPRESVNPNLQHPKHGTTGGPQLVSSKIDTQVTPNKRPHALIPKAVHSIDGVPLSQTSASHSETLPPNGPHSALDPRGV
jgi:hypothetical protein